MTEMKKRRKANAGRSKSVGLPNGISVMELKQITAKRIAEAHLGPANGRSKSTSPKIDDSFIPNLKHVNSFRSCNGSLNLNTDSLKKKYSEAVHGLTVKELKNLTSLRLAREEKEGHTTKSQNTACFHSSQSSSSLHSSPDHSDSQMSPFTRREEHFPPSPGHHPASSQVVTHQNEISFEASTDYGSDVCSFSEISQTHVESELSWNPFTAVDNGVNSSASYATPMLTVDLVAASPRLNTTSVRSYKRVSPLQKKLSWNEVFTQNIGECNEPIANIMDAKPQNDVVTNTLDQQEYFPLFIEDEEISLQVAESVLTGDGSVDSSIRTLCQFDLFGNMLPIKSETDFVIDRLSHVHLEIIPCNEVIESDSDLSEADEVKPWPAVKKDTSHITPIGAKSSDFESIESPCASLFKLGYEWERNGSRFFAENESRVPAV